MGDYSYDRTDKTAGKSVKDKLDVKLSILRAVQTREGHRRDEYEFDVSGALELRSDLGRIPLLVWEANVEVQYSWGKNDRGYFQPSIVITNKNQLGNLAAYIESLLEDSWHEWIDSLPAPEM